MLRPRLTSHADAAKIARKIVDEVQAASPQAAGQPPEKPVTPPQEGGGGPAGGRQEAGHRAPAGGRRVAMDPGMRDALAEVEKDRSQLSGVIVSRWGG